ncbi:MAG: hypothetical protein HOW73_25865 [Polyangiaceae bacterium]|nr:hypothetical protein [Polyangiaceae bacterium]
MRRLACVAATAAAVLTGVSLFAPSSAHACWDGYDASIGPLTILQAESAGSWSPAQARLVARWGTRIARLLPVDAKLSIELGSAWCEGNGCGSVTGFDVDLDRWQNTFDEIAKQFAVSKAVRDDALEADPEVYTVQVFAGTLVGARDLKEKVIGLGGDFFGFYAAGGYPANKDDAHILGDGTSVHRVVVGAYLSKTEAEAAAKRLAAAGFKGFVRELPLLSTVEERSSSMAG